MLFKSAEFFFLLATLHTQKKVKEIAYILTSYQALLKAQLFFLLFVLGKDNKEKRQNNGNEVFICFSLLIKIVSLGL